MGADGELLLKLETCQPTGAFKVRGALNALSNLPADTPVVTASAGNAGLGVAYAAGRLGRTATIVVPGTAAAPKVAALRRLGAELVQVGTSYDEAEARALELVDETGAYYLSSYNDPLVIAGQGTIGHELDAQLSGPLTVVCGLGGGGLASGLGLWASTRADVRVVGVEAAASTAMSATVAAGHDVQVTVGETLADGLEGNLERGSVTVGLVAEHVHSMVTVTEEELRSALRHLATERGVVAEGAAAAPVAAVLAGKVPGHGTTVAVVSGRNIAMPVYASILAEG
ncbi:MAG: pyridoxal-phosphate dependent enzyme [Streptosporangiales bacterium]|nr:pyridoxal-phosphate dependent enzyme [Streptosporangiales bacterium]